MLSRFQPSDIAKIRSDYSNHILYKTLNDACFSCCEEVKSYPLRPEQVFVEVIRLLDELKQQQEDVHWDKLYRSIRQDYQMQDEIITDDDLTRISITIVYALASVLLASFTNYYHRLSRALFEQVVESQKLLSQKSLDELINSVEKNDDAVADWLRQYMKSDYFESDAFNEYFSPVRISDKGTPQHIRFSDSASTRLRNEFTGILKKAIDEKKNWGKAGRIKQLLAKYQDENVIVLSGTETDIYRDLCMYFNYNQKYPTFNAAIPNLVKIQKEKS